MTSRSNARKHWARKLELKGDTCTPAVTIVTTRKAIRDVLYFL